MTELRPQSESPEDRQPAGSPSRTLWYSNDLSIVDEPLLFALLKYRQAKNRVPVHQPGEVKSEPWPNLVSSLSPDGRRQVPILDLDYPHRLHESYLLPERVFVDFLGAKRRDTERVQRALYTFGLSDTPTAPLDGYIILDARWHYELSTQKGHGHLYIDEQLSHFEWFILMLALRRSRFIELGYFVWSLRRGANFVRLPGTEKQDFESYTYGWLFKLRGKK